MAQNIALMPILQALRGYTQRLGSIAQLKEILRRQFCPASLEKCTLYPGS